MAVSHFEMAVAAVCLTSLSLCRVLAGAWWWSRLRTVTRRMDLFLARAAVLSVPEGAQRCQRRRAAQQRRRRHRRHAQRRRLWQPAPRPHLARPNRRARPKRDGSRRLSHWAAAPIHPELLRVRRPFLVGTRSRQPRDAAFAAPPRRVARSARCPAPPPRRARAPSRARTRSSRCRPAGGAGGGARGPA